MTTLEKIAWTCVEAYYATGVGVGLKPESWDSLRDFEKTVALAQARAAVEAMRDVDTDVSPAVLVAGKKALYSCSEDPELEDARGCYHAMIDAILNEKR